MNKEMYLTKSDIGIVAFFVMMAVLMTVLLFGCTGNVTPPIFGLPDEVFVTTVQAIQGKTGYYFELIRSAGTVSEVVIGLAHPGVSPHPFYILVRDTATTPEGAAIRRLQGATQVGFSREVPEGYVILGTKEVDIDLRLGQNTPTYSVTRYLFCTTQKGYKVYFPICLTFDDVAYRKFWEIVEGGPKVIGESMSAPFTEEVKQAAAEIMDRLLTRYRTLRYSKPTQSLNEINDRFHQAALEVLGFGLGFIERELAFTYTQVKGIEFGNFFTSLDKPYFDLIEGYLRVKLSNPGKNKEELLKIFETHVEDGSIDVQ